MDNMPCQDNGSLNNRFGSLKDNSGSLDDENSKESGSLKDNLGSLSHVKRLIFLRILKPYLHRFPFRQLWHIHKREGRGIHILSGKS